MKKCLIIFTIAILSIIPISKVSALTGNDGLEYTELPEEGPYTIFKSKKGATVLAYYLNGTTTINGIDNSIDLANSYYFYLYGSAQIGNVKYYTYDYDSNKWNYKNTGMFSAPYSVNDFGFTSEEYVVNPTIATPYLEDIIISSNVNFFLCWKGTNTLVYTPNVIKHEYLTFSANKANDLDGIDIYNFRFNANNYNSSYKYLIKTEQQIEWTDITEELNNEAYQYDYILYYNTTIYMQVLDENNDVLETKTHQITDLEEFGINITFNDATDEKDRDIVIITFDARRGYIPNYKYRYTYGASLGKNDTYYEIDISQGNLVEYIPHALFTAISFELVDEKENIIYSYCLDARNFSKFQKHVIINRKTSDFGYKKNVEINIDFSQYEAYSDMYNLSYHEYLKKDEPGLEEMVLAKNFIVNEGNFSYYKNLYFTVSVDNEPLEVVDLIDYIYGDFDTIYEETLEKELEEALGKNDYSSVSNMMQSVRNFMNAISTYTEIFFKLIMRFFNRLNVYLRSFIISIFIETVIFKVIKAVRKS